MHSKNHPIILFLDRSGFSIFQDTLPNIAKFNFTPDIVANLDVVNKDQFASLIATFIQINKIVPSGLALILSDNIIYEKDLVNIPQKPTTSPTPLGLETPLGADKEHKEEVQKFLENVPFEDVLAKVVKTDKSNRIVAVNRDLVMTIADVFRSKGATIEAIIPGFVYGPNVNFAAGLTQNNIQVVLGESEILRLGNLLTDQQTIIAPQSLEIEQKEKEKKPQSLRQFILVGVFITLLVILGVVYLNMGASPTPPESKNSVVIPTNIPSSIPIQISTTQTDLRNIKIKIVQSSGSQDIAGSLSSQLLAAGFSDVVTEISQDVASEKSSIIFASDVPSDVREKAFIESKKILPDVSILENQDINLTVTILIGKS